MRTHLMIGLLATLAFVGLTPQASAEVASAEVDADALTDCIGNVGTNCDGGLCVANVGVPSLPITTVDADLAVANLEYTCSSGVCAANVVGSCDAICVGNVVFNCGGDICAANAVGSCYDSICVGNVATSCGAICAANVLTSCSEGICVGNVASDCNGPLCVANVLTTCGENDLVEAILALVAKTGEDVGTVNLSA